MLRERGSRAGGGAQTSVSIQMPKHMWTDNLFTLAIFWKKKWEGGEAGSTVDSHVLSQQMWAVGPRAVSPWHHATTRWRRATRSWTTHHDHVEPCLLAVGPPHLPPPFTQSPTAGCWGQAGGGWLEDNHDLQLRWSWPTACGLQGRGRGVQNYQASSQRGSVCSSHISAGQLQGKQTWKWAQDGGWGTFTEWEATGLRRDWQHIGHTSSTTMSNLQTALKSHLDLSSRHFPSNRAKKAHLDHKWSRKNFNIHIYWKNSWEIAQWPKGSPAQRNKLCCRDGESLCKSGTSWYGTCHRREQLFAQLSFRAAD